MRKVLSIFLTISMILSISIFSTYADDSSNTNQHACTLISSETITASNGVSVNINRYDDNGVIVDTLNVNSANARLSDEEINATIEEIANQYSTEYLETNTNIMPYVARDLYYTKDFDNTSTSPSNSYCKARHWGQFYGGTYHYLGVSDGASRAQYTGSTTPTKLTIMESFTFSGLGISISWPAGVSLESSDKTYTWYSSAYNNTKVATAYWDDFYADGINCLGVGFSLECYTRSDIYIGSSSYASSVTNSQSYFGSW